MMAAAHMKEDDHCAIRERIQAWADGGFFRDPGFSRAIRIRSVEEKYVFHIEVVTQFCAKTEEQRRYCGVPDAYERNSELENSFKSGTRSRLIVEQVDDCPTCGATGGDICFLCKGEGVITCEMCNGQGGERCPECSGVGRRRSFCSCAGGRDGWGERCASCGGSGSVETNCGSCNATGWKSCLRCGGQRRQGCSPCKATGFINCEACQGARQISIAMQTEWKYDVFRQNRTCTIRGLPAARCRRVTGKETFSETSAEALARIQNHPGFPIEFGKTLQAAVAARKKRGAEPMLHRVTLREVSVQEVRYALNDENPVERILWLIGSNIYAPKAPKDSARVFVATFFAAAVAATFLLFVHARY